METKTLNIENHQKTFGNFLNFFKFNKKVSAAKKSKNGVEFEKTPLHLAIAGYVSYMFLFVVSWLRELLYGMGPLRGSSLAFCQPKSDPHCAPLYASFESFYTRNVYRRLKDIFHQPISSVPGAKVSIFSYFFKGKKTKFYLLIAQACEGCYYVHITLK